MIIPSNLTATITVSIALRMTYIAGDAVHVWSFTWFCAVHTVFNWLSDFDQSSLSLSSCPVTIATRPSSSALCDPASLSCCSSRTLVSSSWSDTPASCLCTASCTLDSCALSSPSRWVEAVTNCVGVGVGACVSMWVRGGDGVVCFYCSYTLYEHKIKLFDQHWNGIPIAQCRTIQ